MTSKYTCRCGKQYIRQDAFKRHETMCRLIYNYNYNRDNNGKAKAIEINENIQPTNTELYIMIVNLMNKYDKLQNDYDKLKSVMTKAKRDFDIIDYLKNNYECNISLIDFIKNTNFNINIHEFEYICEKGYSKGVLNLLLRYIKTYQSNVPICAFDIKINKIYVFIQDKWCIVDNDIQRQIFSLIDVKIFDAFKEWKNYYETKMDSDVFSEIYIKNMKKIMVDIDVKNKMMPLLYKNIMVNVKDIIK